jgi:DNA helicase-2/ATP-dependent DNA helicase PcrA
VVALRKLGEAGYREVKAQTLHSFCFSLLWRQGVLLATARTPRIVMEFERDYALVDLDGVFGGLRDRRKMAVDFESAWARRQTDEPGQPVEGLDQAFQDELLAWSRWHQAS